MVESPSLLLVHSPLVVVGHSGAGAFLPAIGAAVANPGGLVFVDAVVPPTMGVHTTPDGLAALLDEQAVDGLLAPWLDWWPDDVVAQLVPDREDEAELRADMPQLSRSFYDVGVEVPAGWATGACAFVRLSAAYTSEAEEARARGWPTLELDSTHLAPFTDPDLVLDAIVRLDGRFDQSRVESAGPESR